MKIQIYLSTKSQDQLENTRRKYHVSLSTIAQILSDYFKPNFLYYDNEFFNKYKETEHRNRTTIKPNNLNEASDLMQTCKGELSIISHVMSNLLFLYANEQYEYLFNETNKNKIEKYKKDLEKEFLKKREIYWNYNNRLRDTIRIIRKNKEYFERKVFN